METAKQAANYVSETVQGAISGASKETNKEVAKDSNASVGTRYVIASTTLSLDRFSASLLTSSL